MTPINLTLVAINDTAEVAEVSCQQAIRQHERREFTKRCSEHHLYFDVPMTPITYALLIINCAIYGLQTQAVDSLITRYALWPPGAGFEPWQILSCAFLHGSLLHLGSNMFGLWMFGRDVERALGSSRFSALYFVSVLTASFAQIAFSLLTSDAQPSVGASGGLFGVLMAYAMLFPRNRIMLIFFPMPLPAPLFVTLYAGFEFYAGVTGSMNGVAHFAHLGGLVGAFALMCRWRNHVPHDN